MHFIGAGPGAADLITLRAPRPDRVVAGLPVRRHAGPAEMLELCPPGARLVDTAELTLDEIVAEMVAAHEAGHDVARLRSGDPSVFSAVAEQMRRLDAAGVPYDVSRACPPSPRPRPRWAAS